MVTERQLKYQDDTEEYLSDSAIMDLFNPVLSGSLGYHDKIVAMIAQGHENDRMVLEFKHYDLPDQLLNPFWKLGEAERIVKCLNQKVQEVFEYVHRKEYPENQDIHYDEIEAKFIIDDDKLVSKIHHAKDDRVLNKKIVCFDGIVISKTNTIPEIVQPVYRCFSCGQKHEDEVKKCIQCDSKKIDVSMNDSKIVKTEYLTIQEHQKDMVSGEIEPERIDVVVSGSLTKKFFPGNHVRVTGFPKIFSPRGNMINERLSKGYNKSIVVPSGLSVIVEAHNIQYMKTPLEILLSNPKKVLTEYDEKAIQGLRKKYNDIELLNVLSNSFAPNIYGHQIIKETILIQSVGAAKVEGERSNINILMVGDPGIGKSKLLIAAKDVNIHSAMAVGKGASGVGLTASVIQVNGIPRLNVGAAVLAHKGICIIDELSNIPDEYKAHLLECMENGTFTVNKHGINQSLNANAAFLVASNPDSGRYSSYNTLTENIKISPPLLSRFDLIFVIIDSVNNDEDQKLNVHTGAKWNSTIPPADFIQQSGDRIETDLLRKYLIYAKLNNQTVRISKSALKRFDQFYKDLRRPVKSSDVTATRRQYEGMLRIATAMTRILLKNEVTEEIAEYVIKIMNSAYESTGMKLGNSTGLNQTALFSKDLTKLKPERAFIEVMKLITKDNTTPVTFVDMIFALEEHLHMSKSEGEELIFKMDRRDVFHRPGTNTYLLDTSSYHT